MLVEPTANVVATVGRKCCRPALGTAMQEQRPLQWGGDTRAKFWRMRAVGRGTELGVGCLLADTACPKAPIQETRG